METMICKCGSHEFITKPCGPHIGIYCACCKRWQKWTTKLPELKIEFTQEHKLGVKVTPLIVENPNVIPLTIGDLDDKCPWED